MKRKRYSVEQIVAVVRRSEYPPYFVCRINTTCHVFLIKNLMIPKQSV